MKISKSKQELARIIRENGGWRDGAEFAWYGNQTKKGWFGISKPRYSPKQKSLQILRHYLAGSFPCRKVANWHQTILSRTEYFHLYPALDADGWIEWDGGTKSPAGEGVLVDVKMRCGREHYCQLLDDECWSDAWGDENIIAYRLHKPGQAKPEFCDSVMRSIPEPEINSKNINITQVDDINVVESKPTIEQLAADYRNAKDCAELKQQEADAAKDDADAKLKALELAGEALGLVLSVGREGGAVTPMHPPLIAGDWRSWRQWEVGDVISWSIVGHIGEFRIIAVHHDPSRNIGDFEIEDKQGGVYRAYGNECKFIRRP